MPPDDRRDKHSPITVCGDDDAPRTSDRHRDDHRRPARPGLGARVPGDVATAWYDLLLKLVADEKRSPPARALAYVGVVLYEAVVPGMPTHRSLAGQLNGLRTVPTPLPSEAYHWPSAANSAVATVMRSVFALRSEVDDHTSGNSQREREEIEVALWGQRVRHRGAGRERRVGVLWRAVNATEVP